MHIRGNRSVSGRAAGAVLLWCALAAGAAHADGGLAALTQGEASGGLKAALGQGIDRAVNKLGAPGGFLDNETLRIPLPPALEKADRALRLVGMSGEADALDVAMNRAAESAVGEAKPILVGALKKMTIRDAKSILTGGDGAATDYFRRSSGDALRAKFRPIVARATQQVKLGAVYDRYAGQAASLGLLSGEDANLDEYVTGKALEGLFSVIADQEHSIRADPVAAGSALIKRVFGSL